jgi:hypothetical protein
VDISRQLSISTSHLTREEMDLLSRMGQNLDYRTGEPAPLAPVVAEYPEGCLVYVAGWQGDAAADVVEDYEEHAREEGLGPAFLGITRAARALGCRYVLMDRDAPEHPDLPVFDW